MTLFDTLGMTEEDRNEYHNNIPSTFSQDSINYVGFDSVVHEIDLQYINYLEWLKQQLIDRLATLIPELRNTIDRT